MKTIFRLSLLALVLVALAGIAVAQDTTFALIYTSDSVLYKWDDPVSGEPAPYAACQPNEKILGEITLSPDGRHIGIVTEPIPVTEKLAEIGGVGGGALPGNLWLCLDNGSQLVRVGEQPANFAFFDDDQTVPDFWISRGLAVWSPAGDKVAWTELVGNDSDQWVIYDLASNTTATYALDLPPVYGIPSPLDMKWAQSGIYILAPTYNQSTNENEVYLYRFDENGVQQFIYDVLGLMGGGSDFLTDWVVVQDNGVERIALWSDQLGWLLWDPLSGSTQAMNGLLEAYSPYNASLSLVFDEENAGQGQWFARYNGQLYPLAGIEYRFDRVALSTGGTLAYRERFDSIIIWDSGGILHQRQADYSTWSMVWAPVAWRIYRDGNTGAADCPGFTSRLVVGERGRVVLDLGANNLRQEASTGSRVLVAIPEGGEFAVMDGPVCADGYAWWQVNYNGVIGWTAEGEGSTYWVEPLGP